MRVTILDDILQKLKVNLKWIIPLPYRLPIFGRVFENGAVVQVLSLEEQGLPQVGHFLYLAHKANLFGYLPKDTSPGQICVCFSDLITPQFFVLGWAGTKWEWTDYDLIQPEADYQVMSLDALLLSDRL